MRKSIRDTIPKDLYEDLVNRRKKVKEVAKELNVTPNYLSAKIPERASKRNYKLLKAARNLFEQQITRETVEGRHTVEQAARLACVSERTMFRRLAEYRKSNAART